MLQFSKSISVPEAETGSTNVAGLESLMNRANPVKKLCFALIAAVLIFGGCEDDKEFTVTFDSKGGSAVAAQTVKDGGKLTEPKEPAREGFGFEGWAKADNETAARWDFVAETVTANMTLYARWSANTYAVTFNSNGGSAVTSQNIKDGEKATKPADPTRDGYTFEAWYKEEALTTVWNFDTDPVKANITLYAKWIENVYLVTEIAREGDDWASVVRFEYDAQNRIIKVDDDDRIHTLTYNSAGDLISIIEGNGNLRTFTKSGNTIGMVCSWWNDEDGYSETMKLNAQGLVETWTWESNSAIDNWYKGVSTCQYQGKNLIKESYVWEGEWNGAYGSGTSTSTFTYDNQKSPFYHCKTLQWFFVYWDFIEYGVENNPISAVYDDENSYTYEYTYNAHGFPLTRKITNRLDGGVYEYTETFKYGVPSGQKSAVGEASGPSSVGASPDNNPRKTHERQGSRRFGGRIL